MAQGQSEGGSRELLLVLADGMGGHRGGAAASRIAVEAFGNAFGSRQSAVSDRLDDGLEMANQAVAEAASGDPALHDMGTTLVGAHILNGNRLRWISVGDSPLWRLDEGCLTRLNKDHSMKPVLPQLVEMGLLTADEAESDLRRHQLRSAVMGNEIPHIDLQDEAVELATDHVVVIASDGLETLDEALIANILESNRDSATSTVNALLAAVQAEHQPRQDNTTVIVFIVEQVNSTGENNQGYSS